MTIQIARFVKNYLNLKVDLIILLAEFEYPPIDRDEVYKEIFEQAKNLQTSKMV